MVAGHVIVVSYGSPAGHPWLTYDIMLVGHETSMDAPQVSHDGSAMGDS